MASVSSVVLSFLRGGLERAYRRVVINLTVADFVAAVPNMLVVLSLVVPIGLTFDVLAGEILVSLLPFLF